MNTEKTTRGLYNFGRAVAGTMALGLAVTLYRIRRVVIKQRKENDANWAESVDVKGDQL